MPDTKSGDGTKKALRGPRYHVRSGCRTCKIRRVKCDEEKPACQNCRKTGRLCDGHTQLEKKDSAVVPSLLFGKIYGLSGEAMSNMHLSFLQSNEERRYYDYFQCQIGQQIRFAFGSATQAHQLILQASHSSTSIKHTVIALASLAEHLNETNVPSHTIAHGKCSLQYAFNQYIKAIGQLQKDVSEHGTPPTEFILTACLLLTLFDFLCGEDLNARTHLAAGIDIIRRCYPTELLSLGNNNCETRPTHQPSPLIRDFAQIFSTMDLYAAIWLGGNSFNTQPMISGQFDAIPWYQLPPNPGLADLSTYLNYQLVRAHAFHHTNAPTLSGPVHLPLPFPLQAEKARLIYELQQWPWHLQQCLGTTPPLTTEQGHCVALMRINHHSILIALSNFFLRPDSASLHEPFMSNFAAILADAEALLHPPHQPTMQHPNRGHLLRAVAINAQEPNAGHMSPFAFVCGVCQPLYLTATKCPDDDMSEQAVTLLEEQPSWREGAWNSTTMARLARREMSKRAQQGEGIEVLT